MKLVIVILSFLPGIIFSQVPEPYAAFPFDDNFNDVMGNVTAEIPPDGIVSIVADPVRGWVAYFPGKDTAADEELNFINLSLNTAGFDALTYNVWINADEMSTWSRIITCSTTEPDGIYPEFFVTPYNGRLNQQASLSFDYNKGPLGDQNDEALVEIPGDTLTAGTWYMLTVAQDATHLKLWVNAKSQGDSLNYSGKTPAECEYPAVMLGKSGWPDPLFKGKMDNFKIWNEFLTDGEVSELYGICCPSGEINRTEMESPVKVSVNPTTGQISIDLGQDVYRGEYTLQIINSMGQQVLLETVNQQKTILDLSGRCGKGICLVTLSDHANKTISVNKIVIQ